MRMPVLLLAFLGLTLPALAQESGFSHALTTPSGVLVPLPAEQILQGSSGVFADVQGRWLVAGRVKFPDSVLSGLESPADAEESSLHLWSARTRRTTLLWREPGMQFPKPLFAIGERVLVQLDRLEGPPRLLLVNPVRATVQELTLPKGLSSVHVDPGGECALVQLWEKEGVTLALLKADGRLTPFSLGEQEVPQGFTPDQKALYVVQLDPKTRTRKYFRQELATGARTPLKERPEWPPKPIPGPENPLRFVTEPTTLGEKKVPMLWLEDREKKRTRLGPELQPIALLPTAAIYGNSQGGLFALPLYATDAKTLEEKEKQLLTRAITATARQIDSALEQYALDNKSLPAPGSDLIALLCGPERYIRSSDSFYDAKGKPLLQWVWDGHVGTDGKPLKGASLATLAWKYGTVTIRSDEGFEFK
jgi:hypothetical protein